MTTTEEKLTLARECGFEKSWIGKCKQAADESGFCQEHNHVKCCVCRAQATHDCDHTGQFVCGAPLCDNCHGHTDISKPRGVWGFGGHTHVRKATPEEKPKAIATEPAPAAAAASIDTEKLAEEFGLWSEQREKFVAHVAQQREAGRQAEEDVARLIFGDLHKSRTEWRERAEKAEAALAQLAASELPPLPEPGIDVYRIKGYKADQMQAYARNHETHLMLSHAPLMDAASAKHRIASLEAQLAARAVGGVDLSSLKRYSPTYDESRGADGEDRWGVMEDAEEGEYVKLTDVRALLATAPAAHTTEAAPVLSAQAPVVAAPVDDGDERAKALEEAAKAVEQCYTGLGGPPDDPHPDAVLVNSTVNECAKHVRALIQQRN